VIEPFVSAPSSVANAAIAGALTKTTAEDLPATSFIALLGHLTTLTRK
jgi:hypothetical protein